MFQIEKNLLSFGGGGGKGGGYKCLNPCFQVSVHLSIRIETVSSLHYIHHSLPFIKKNSSFLGGMLFFGTQCIFLFLNSVSLKQNSNTKRNKSDTGQKLWSLCKGLTFWMRTWRRYCRTGPFGCFFHFFSGFCQSFVFVYFTSSFWTS